MSTRAILRRLFALAALACAGLIALGFLGRWGAAFDSLSHFRLHLGVGVLVLALGFAARRHVRLAVAGGIAAGAALFTTLPFVLPAPDLSPEAGAATYSLLQMNLLYKAETRQAALQRIADTRPDIVTVQEMTADWRETLRPLEAAYPYQLHCEGADGRISDSAILSRRPFAEGLDPVCDRRNSLAAAVVDFNGVDITIVSHHQLWPWPAGQWQRLERLRPVLEALPAPVILAGDFNAVPWSALVEAYERVLGVRAARGIGGTWLIDVLPIDWARIVGLPIDNVLVSPAVTVQAVRSLDATSSDHLPVLVTFSVTRDEGAEPPVQIVRR